MTIDLAERHTGAQPPGLDTYRPELTRYCRRILGSSFEADDAVQETMLRAWRSLDRFEGRSSVKTWLHRIALNVCCDMLQARHRRPTPTGLGTHTDTRVEPAGWPRPRDIQADASHLGATLTAPDPGDRAVTRESVRHAFAAALHHLPPRQRAVLILREVLRWPASETAELLGDSVASVNSALQRARAKLASGFTSSLEGSRRRQGQRHEDQLVSAYADALERTDVDSLISHLVADATGAVTTNPNPERFHTSRH